MNQPVIKTRRLLLRPFEQGDANEVQKLAGNKNVSASTLHIPFPYKDGMAKEWISTHISNWENREGITYAVTDIISSKLLGTVSLIGIRNSEAELGYWIGETYWRKGYCTEAARALVEYSFTNLGVTKIVAEHLSSNPASGRVLDKIGMEHLKQVYKLDRNGVRVQVAIYELQFT